MSRSRIYLYEIYVGAWLPTLDLAGGVISRYNEQLHQATNAQLELHYTPDFRAAGGRHRPDTFFRAVRSTGGLSVLNLMPDYEVQSGSLQPNHFLGFLLNP